MEISETNDYFLNYSNKWSKPKPIKRKAVNYSLKYGQQTILERVLYAVCRAKINELKKLKQFQTQEFKILPNY